MTTAVKWACDVCGAAHDSIEAAAECEAQPLLEPTLKVGDIVTCRGGFGWYDGDRAWIQNAEKVDSKRTGQPDKHRGKKCPSGDGNCFDDCCTFSFYYVVTFIDREQEDRTHRPRYHLRTLAMVGGHQEGYTFDVHHYTPSRVSRPPRAVVQASKALLGSRTDRLL